MQTRLSRRRFLVQAGGVMTLSGTSPLAWATTHGGKTPRVTVAAHPWVYAATMPDRDITPALDAIFADMKHAGMDAIELMHTALYPEDAVARISELSQKHQLPVLGTSYGAAMWDRQQHDKIREDAQLVITRLARLGRRTLGTSVGDTGGKKTPLQLDAQADILHRLWVSVRPTKWFSTCTTIHMKSETVCMT